MIYILLGFVFGCLIPYIARRFEKFMPATLAYGLYRILKSNKSVSRAKKKNNHKYIKLMKEYIMYSLGWAVICSSLTYFTSIHFSTDVVAWHIFFVWSMLLLMEIDKRMLLLPDILTIPLLIIGFLYAAMGIGLVVVGDSAFGAFAGYFLPISVSLLIVWRDKDAFGGGDIKLLSAVGAWLGLEALLYVIILSCFIFAAYAIARKKRAGAFGPAIVVASLVVMYVFF